MLRLEHFPRHSVIRLAASLAIAIALCGCAIHSLTPSSAQQGAGAHFIPDGVRYYPVKPSGAGVTYITTGPDKALWFTETTANEIGRITTSGKIKYYKLAGGAQPYGITAGPDKSVWFGEENSKVGQITATGRLIEHNVHYPASAITEGPDGALWFYQNFNGANYIGRMTAKGSVKEYKFKSSQRDLDSGIVTGPDKALWFTLPFSNQVGRITTSGKVKLYTETGSGGQPWPITSDGGALWVGEDTSIARVSTSGNFTDYPLLPGYGGGVYGITRGANNDVWFSVTEGEYIGTLVGKQIKEYPLGSPSDHGIWGITLGPDKALWFCDNSNNRIGRYTP